MRRMQEQGAEHMYLDARHFGAEMWEHRFPTILAACRAHGIDPVTEPIPVAPAAHYASGGVRTDLHGRTTVPGPVRLRRGRLHGRARREPARLQLPPGGPGLRRAHRRRHRRGRAPATACTRACPQPVPHPETPAHPLLAPEARFAIQRIMTEGAGVLRSADSLRPRPPALERLHTARPRRPRRERQDGRARRRHLGGHQPPVRRPRPGRRRPAARGDPRLPLARGPPRPRRRRLAPPPRRTARPRTGRSPSRTHRDTADFPPTRPAARRPVHQEP